MIYGSSPICDKPHHLWCNFYVEETECKLCDRLYKEAPYNSIEDLCEYAEIKWPEITIIGKENLVEK